MLLLARLLSDHHLLAARVAECLTGYQLPCIQTLSLKSLFPGIEFMADDWFQHTLSALLLLEKTTEVFPCVMADECQYKFGFVSGDPQHGWASYELALGLAQVHGKRVERMELHQLPRPLWPVRCWAKFARPKSGENSGIIPMTALGRRLLVNLVCHHPHMGCSPEDAIRVIDVLISGRSVDPREEDLMMSVPAVEFEAREVSKWILID